MNWDELKESFAWDGSLRDIYVWDASPAHWTRWLEALPMWTYVVSYSVDGVETVAPRNADEAFVFETTRLLSIDVEGMQVNCHFFCVEIIELDLDPREVKGPAELAALERFIRRLGLAVGLPVRMTPENLADEPVFIYSPTTDAFTLTRGSRHPVS